MNLLIYLVVAAIIGWVATELMHDRSNLLINIVVAVVGAFLAGYLLSPIFKVGTINDAITIPTMLVTLLGSIILLGIVHLFRGRGHRSG
ncbi:MAG: GlsB/YeaQ/YmgE family stress response membrane protein [Anaerolineales bacterium]